jgi:hypothetical protein
MSLRQAILTVSLLAVVFASARGEEPISEADREFWSFRTPVRVEPPLVEGEAGPIDRFLVARLASEGLVFAPEADRRTLIRRVSFDLTGLPPEPAEVEAFVDDESPEAYAHVVDRLLASPAYGERWAQHWLDVVRFAESDGFEHDVVRPEAWRYRDWVIGALNADMPYDRFVQLQLAADEIAPEESVATGLLLAGPDMPDLNEPEERRHIFLNGMTSTVGEAFMALTFGCAQCHDHKTDPMSTDDFYRLRAIFANTMVGLKRDEKLGSVVRETGREVPVSFVMTRGDFQRPGNPVEAAFPRVLDPGEMAVSPPDGDAASSMRRTAFARWLTRPDHPLTARVIVNRLWQHHFGAGIVASSGDFGHTGEQPAHPELLDWLATELPVRGWSLKEMHRLMVTSRAYRQASRGGGEAWERALEHDPGNRLLSRMSRRRLEGEAIRDTFLAVSGQLNREAGGPSVRPPLPKEVTSTLLQNQWEVTPDEAGHRRRSVYVFARRNLRYPIFEAFDRPDSNLTCSRRDRSTTAPQSLMLLNSEFSLATAEALAARISVEASDTGERIERAYAHLFSRPPESDERALGRRFLDRGSLVEYCLALLNTNEAIYVD